MKRTSTVPPEKVSGKSSDAARRITRAVHFAATGARCGYDVITWSASAACAPDVRCEGFTHSRRQQLLDAQARSATLIACGVRRDVALRDSPLGIEIPIPNQEEDPPMPEQKHVVETVKSGIIDSIRGTGEVVDAAINTVSGTLVNTIKGTGAVGAALTGTVSDVLRGAILGTAQAGADIRDAAKGGVIGVIRGTREVGVEATESISAGARSVVRSAAEVGGDLGAVARSAVEGSIAGAKELGLKAEDAASAAASGAIKGAGEIGGTAVEQVRKAMTDVIAGVKVVVKEPFKSERKAG